MKYNSLIKSLYTIDGLVVVVIVVVVMVMVVVVVVVVVVVMVPARWFTSGNRITLSLQNSIHSVDIDLFISDW